MEVSLFIRYPYMGMHLDTLRSNSQQHVCRFWLDLKATQPGSSRSLESPLLTVYELYLSSYFWATVELSKSRVIFLM